MDRPNVTINGCNNVGNITNSNNNKYKIFISDEKWRVLEWFSPLASRKRHQTVREARVPGVGDWLVRNQMFSTWRTSEDQAVKPVLLCCGDPGVGRAFMR